MAEFNPIVGDIYKLDSGDCPEYKIVIERNGVAFVSMNKAGSTANQRNGDHLNRSVVCNIGTILLELEKQCST